MWGTSQSPKPQKASCLPVGVQLSSHPECRDCTPPPGWGRGLRRVMEQPVPFWECGQNRRRRRRTHLEPVSEQGLAQTLTFVLGTRGGDVNMRRWRQSTSKYRICHGAGLPGTRPAPLGMAVSWASHFPVSGGLTPGRGSKGTGDKGSGGREPGTQEEKTGSWRPALSRLSHCVNAAF